VDPATAGELSGLVALSAATGDSDLMRSEVLRTEESSTTIEGHFYARFARLISAAVVDEEAHETRRTAAELLFESAAAEFTDAFVIAYRAYPPLLGLVGRHEKTRRLVGNLLLAANDGALAGKWGYTEATRARSSPRFVDKAGDGSASAAC
jgi:hypothetical protein